MTAFLLSLAAVLGVAGLIAWVDRKGHLTRPLNEPITQLRIDYPALDFIDTLVTADGRNTLALGRSGRGARLRRQLGDPSVRITANRRGARAWSGARDSERRLHAAAHAADAAVR